MSTVVKDLGAVSAYAYAVEKGYTGTEAEFAELMADYAEVGQRAEDAADSALESKTAAQTAANTATNKASEATTAAQTATTKAGEASTSASTATSAKDTAVSASQTATSKASEATTAAATATGAATTATTAKDDAVSAKTAAQTAQTGAETAAASVEASAAQITKNATDINELKSDLNDNLLDYIETVNPTNWFNNDGLVAGELNANGTVSESTTRKYTDYFIPVSEGLKVYFRRGDNFASAYMRHITAYDANKNVLSSKGSDSSTSAYTIQTGVAYVKITIDNPNLSVFPMLTVGSDAPTSYSAYFEPYDVLTKNFLTPEGNEALTALETKSLKSSDLANKYACSLPHTKLRQTVGIEETFYTQTARTPVKTTYSLFSAGDEYQQRITEDVVTLPNTSVLISVNGFRWRMYDGLYTEIKNNITNTYQNGWPRNIIAENLSSCSLLAIGDSTVDQDVMTQKILDHFTAQGATLTLLGTLGSGNNKNEGRAGWKASDYLTDRQYSGVTNPFYNPTSGTFDFNYYMGNQGYSAPDFVVIQLGINDLGSTNDYAAIWSCITTMIDSILDYNSNIKILLNLPTTPTSDQSKIQSMYLPEYQNLVVNYDEYVILHSLDEYGETKVRCSYCHIILDPDNDIFDNVHPKTGGYEKMALEIVNQINHWQNGD